MADRHRVREPERDPAPQRTPDDGGERRTCPGEAAARAADLAGEVRALAAARLFPALVELGQTITELADLDHRLRAALSQAGYRQPGPVVRELVADVVLAAMVDLRPFVPSVSAESAERSEAELRRGRLGVQVAVKRPVRAPENLVHHG